jgi:hypothetical protein
MPFNSSGGKPAFLTMSLFDLGYSF